MEPKHYAAIALVLAGLVWMFRDQIRLPNVAAWFRRAPEAVAPEPTIEADLHTALGLLARAKRRANEVTAARLALVVESLVKELTS
jgi:hypothetical protein